MERAKLVLLGLLTLVAAGLLIVTLMRDGTAPGDVGRGPSDEPTKTAKRGSAEIRALSREVAALKLAVSNLDAGVRAEEEPALADAEGPGSAPPQPSMSSEMEDALLVESAVTKFDGMLRHERRDEAWATARESSIGQALTITPDAKMESVVCGETLCKVELAHENDDARLRFIQSALGRSPFNTSCFFNSDPDGKRTRLYCSREGHQLPDVEAASQE